MSLISIDPRLFLNRAPTNYVAFLIEPESHDRLAWRPYVAAPMPFRFSIDPSERLISFWGEGCATNEELVAAAAKMFGDPMFNPEFSFLADLTEVTDNRLSSGVVGQIAKSSRFTSNSRRAYVVREQSAERELFRVLEFNVSLFKSGVPRVFPDRSSALQWLRSPAGRD